MLALHQSRFHTLPHDLFEQLLKQLRFLKPLMPVFRERGMMRDFLIETPKVAKNKIALGCPTTSTFSISICFASPNFSYFWKETGVFQRSQVIAFIVNYLAVRRSSYFHSSL
jgi:hypothetical protein